MDQYVPPQQPAPKKQTSAAGGVISLIVLGAIIWYFFLRSPSTATPTTNQIPPAQNVPAGVHDSITKSGNGTGESAPFTLNGGTYAAAWQARSSDSTGCYLGLDLYTSDGLEAGTIASLVVSGSSQSGSSYLNGIPAGSYYVNALTECSWVVALAN